MASTRRKAAAAGLAVIGIAGLSLAAAAQLNLNSESLGAGSTVVASCDADGIDVTFDRAWAAGGDVTSAVNFANVDDDCDTLAYELTVIDGDGAVLDTVGGNVALTSNAFDVAISELTQDVAGISLVITG